MSNKMKKEIVITSKFKQNNADDVTTSLSKVFEMFCNMQTSKNAKKK